VLLPGPRLALRPDLPSVQYLVALVDAEALAGAAAAAAAWAAATAAETVLPVVVVPLAPLGSSIVVSSRPVTLARSSLDTVLPVPVLEPA
jgi:hypothetical protein